MTQLKPRQLPRLHQRGTVLSYQNPGATLIIVTRRRLQSIMLDVVAFEWGAGEAWGGEDGH